MNLYTVQIPVYVTLREGASRPNDGMQQQVEVEVRADSAVAAAAKIRDALAALLAPAKDK